MESVQITANVLLFLSWALSLGFAFLVGVQAAAKAQAMQRESLINAAKEIFTGVKNGISEHTE